jgi:DNA-binding transcriptional LysR family regulator
MDQHAAHHRHLEALMTFLAVARLGRYTAAGEALGVNHSTVSRRIAALEKSMGGRVLARTPSGWEVTDLGRRALAAAEEVETALARLVEGGAESDGALTGTVRIAATDAFAVHVAAPALAELQLTHRRLGVELISATQRARQTRSGVDLEIVVGKPHLHRATTAHVMDYALGLYATEEYLRREGVPGSLAELAGHRLNYYVETALNVDELDRATEQLPRMARGIASTNVLAHVTATLAGAGIGLLPDFVAAREPELRRILVDEYNYLLSYWAAGREEAVRNPAVQAVFGALRAHGHGTA